MILRRLPTFPSWSSPFREIGDVRREMDRLFESLGRFTGPHTAGVFPPMNVTETDDALYVRAELPGIKADHLSLTVEDNTLIVAGERETSPESDEVAYHRREREEGSFRRSIQMPRPVDAGKVEARYVNGVLTVELPKAPEARPRQIAIQAGS